MPSNLMEWRASLAAYVGTTRDGREVRVTGDEVSECLRYAAQQDGIDLDALFAADRAGWQELYDRYRDRQLDPDDWAGLDRDGNHNVETICALCHHQSANEYSEGVGQQLMHDADGNQWYEQQYCACPCHEDGVARGSRSPNVS